MEDNSEQIQIFKVMFECIFGIPYPERCDHLIFSRQKWESVLKQTLKQLCSLNGGGGLSDLVQCLFL